MKKESNWRRSNSKLENCMKRLQMFHQESKKKNARNVGEQNLKLNLCKKIINSKLNVSNNL
jgi:hypothetical protein